MDYIKKNRLLLSIIAVLVILDLATVWFILFGPRPPGPPRGGEPPERLIEHELGFSPEQMNRYTDLREEFFRKGRVKAEAQASAREALLDLLKNQDVSEDEIRQRASVIGNIETGRSIDVYEHFRAVRAICSPEQQRKLDAIIRDILMKVGRPPGPPSPRGR
jgi:protein CpxP